MSLSTIPRPVIFAVIGGVLLLAAFMFMRKGSSEPSSSLKTPPPAAGSGDTKAPPAGDKSASGDSTNNTPSQQGTDSASGSATQSSSTAQAPGGEKGLPASVQKALDQHKVVVVLFWRPVGVDDRNVYDSVQGLRGRSDAVRVFTSGIEDIDRYVAITGAEGITQTPALLVVNRKGKTDVQTGFLDEKTIENTVYNAI